MLIIFDVDGTLIGGESHDWGAFDRAIASVLDFHPDRNFFAALPEITAQAIAEAAVLKAGRVPGTGLEERIRDEYFAGLRQAHARDPRAFPAREGAVLLLEHLAALPGVNVAIATGDWQSTIVFKLAAAGINVARFPMATSSDNRCRAEIIRLAATRANRSLADAIYVGDGVWDLRACRSLGVPFVGTGTRPHLLREAGAAHIVSEFEPATFLAALAATRAAR
jgi:phosphoglycolate phosphatase-like HAD superfamily hydrolase